MTYVWKEKASPFECQKKSVPLKLLGENVVPVDLMVYIYKKVGAVCPILNFDEAVESGGNRVKERGNTLPHLAKIDYRFRPYPSPKGVGSCFFQEPGGGVLRGYG